MVHFIILALDTAFVLLALCVVAAWSAWDKPTHSAPSSAPSKSAGAHAGVLIDVLVRMGFKPQQAEQAAAEIREHCREPLDMQVREALRVLCHGTGGRVSL